MKVKILLLMCITICMSCKQNSNPEASSTSTTFYVGTYTAKDSKGIYQYELSSEGKLIAKGLKATLVNPSFQALSNDGNYLLSIGEGNENPGAVTSYKIEKDTLLLINSGISETTGFCHVNTNAENYILTSNYGAGNAVLFKVNENGELSDQLDLQQHTGSSINENRQQTPHAHSAWFLPNTEKVIICDLGTDELWIYEINKETEKLRLAEQAKLKMNPGAGPRHLCFHPSQAWLYVVNELDCSVARVSMDKTEKLRVEESITTLPENFEGKNTCADIHITSDGKFLYASNRGHNSIAIFTVNQENGELSSIGQQSTMGATPRNFSLSPDENYLLVANQRTDNIVAFKRDTVSGLLTKTSEIYAPTPVCITFTRKL